MRTLNRHRFIFAVVVGGSVRVVSSHVVNTPLVGVETALLVLEERLEEISANFGIHV